MILNDVESEVNKVLGDHGYDVVKMIGQGGFARCYLVYSRRYKLNFACKSIPLSNFQPAVKNGDFSNEYTALVQTIHPYIVQIYEKIITDTHIYFILEYCQNGDLQNYLTKNGPIFDEKKLLKMLFMMVKSLEYLETIKIAHNDIKPSNFLIDQYGRIKITDFGLTKIVKNEEELSEDFRGSLPFMAPEMIGTCPYNPFKVDVWAFGVTVYFLASGKFPFSDRTSLDMKKCIKHGIYSFQPKMGPIIKEIITKCLQVNPQRRETFAGLRNIIEKSISTSQKSVKYPTIRKRFSQFPKNIYPKPLPRTPQQNRIRSIT